MKSNFDGTSRRVLAWTALAAALFGSALPVRAQGLEEPFREPYLKALQGKVVAYLPVAMSFDLAQGWLAGIKRELEPLGVKIVVRDPNWSTNAGAQALTNLISEKPDVIIAHNPDVQTYAKLLQKAESSGIDVVQINMRSSYPTTVFVGADWIEIGRKATTAVVDFCKGKSNKIAIIQGQLSAAASAYTLKGVEDVLAKHSDIKVVSSSGRRLGCVKGKGHHSDGVETKPRPLRHRRFLGWHGYRNRGRHQGSRADGQGLPGNVGRRRAERRLRPGEERIVRS